MVALAALNEYIGMNHLGAWRRAHASTGFPLWLIFVEFQVLTILTIQSANDLFAGKKFEPMALAALLSSGMLATLDRAPGTSFTLTFATVNATVLCLLAIFQRRNPKLFERPNPKATQ